MKLIVGLGNPGLAYAETRHNVGFWVLELFARRHQMTFSGNKREALISRGRWSVPEGPVDFLLVKPQTFMNLSGRSVRGFLNDYNIPISELILIFDDLDLDVGRIRLRKRGRAGGHRGVASVIQAIGSDQFIRVKIGIGKDPKINASDYVLSSFPKDEKKRVLEVVDKGVALLPLLIEGRINEAMDRFNSPQV